MKGIGIVNGLAPGGQPSVFIQAYWVRQCGIVVDSWPGGEKKMSLGQIALRMTMITVPSTHAAFMLRQQHSQILLKSHWKIQKPFLLEVHLPCRLCPIQGITIHIGFMD